MHMRGCLLATAGLLFAASFAVSARQDPPRSANGWNLPANAADEKNPFAGDAEAVHFAWYGANTPEKGFGYRVIGDGFVIEMGSVDEAAQHLHTIYHDLGNVLGRAA